MSEKYDLRIVKTRKALFDAFLELVSEKPFDAITVNEICKRALVRRATFYNHFADKYDFLLPLSINSPKNSVRNLSPATVTSPLIRMTAIHRSHRLMSAMKSFCSMPNF